MIVDIKKLGASLGRALWRMGHVRPEDLKHAVNRDGSHTFTLTAQREDAIWEEPKRNPQANYPSAGWASRKDCSLRSKEVQQAARPLGPRRRRHGPRRGCSRSRSGPERGICTAE